MKSLEQSGSLDQAADGVRSRISAILGEAGRTRRGWLSHLASGTAITVAVLLALALVGWFATRPAAPVRYLSEPIVRGGLTVMVTATGSVQPTTKVDISSELSGTVRKVNVDYNSPVAAGQVLAELDTDKLKSTVDSSRAKLTAARAKVADTQATVREKQHELARKTVLLGKRISSPQDFDVAQAAYDRAVAAVASAQADVGFAEADLQLNETNLTKAKIVSPISGVVLKRNVDPGQTVASTLQAPVLFSIAEDLTKMELQVDVDEADVGKVKPQQSATFSVDAFPGRRFPAKIRDVRYASETVQGVVTYKAVLTIDNSELLLRPGMTATAEIVVSEVSDKLLVANSALRYSPQVSESTTNVGLLRRLMPGPPRFRPPSARDESGRNRTIWLLSNGVPKAARIVIGTTDGKRTEVESGSVAAGDAVIVGQTAAQL